ncbi:PTS mannitol transporter subunit IICBA [Trichococcus shcherbakoviae]|uniref:PTS system mannitol-specific EIICB component n=1 Tax=Trichococcus shcherbakoviae subsp. psychrophilus TaxID=2585775 RepID=A0A5C5E529_9LACT|nr:PTS mannitol transporter subunit IICBA [Trichococcus shcherbakoviae]TNV67987.1 PTS mannitol transporter subunit IICBA [Trichococcus shcherbakoviae subsp. psychrophilus]TNV69504.1 PTS mannitol transporter subunit IICBA [Trichococcus shcherbakoviae subsp. psychrophilus]
MEQTQQASLKAKVQKLGSTLSSMVMPNIGALIAWGVLTALFIPDGYLPNESFASMVGPMLTYLIPLLVGYTGGKVIAGERGAVVGAIATMGVIVGTEIPMIMGAMIMGPLGGFTIKKFDAMFQSKIKTGFEMLVNNFSAGLIGFALALVGFQAIGPVVDRLTQAMAAGVETILNAQLIPLTNIFIEPAKILFLNNAINHGILTPLGTEQVSETGRSILFLLEANPGPGLGVLLAFTLFGKGSAKSTAPGAMIIHFLGGIHEIYFPYVMMKPLLFLAVISGGVSGSFVFQLLGAGLRAPASPGSIIAILAMTPMGSYLPVILGVVAGAAASFAVAAVILKADSKEAVDTFEESVKATQAAKLSAKGLAGQTSLTGIQHIIFACDAGMGSSAMGASILRKKINAAGLPQDVTNRAINNLTDAANTLIVTQEELKNRAQQKAPNATFVAIENFLNSPKYDEIVATLSGTDLKETVVAKPAPVLDFDLANINEIVLVHDDRKGSATMGQKVVERILEREALDIPLRKVHINELEATPQTLVISKNSLTQAAKQKVPAAVHLSVDSLITTPKYESVVANLKQIA